MQLVTEPDVYSPTMDEKGNYVDKVPSFNSKALSTGLTCPCGTRKDKAYTSAALFSAHCKTKTHERWIQDLNANKTNFFSENQSLREIIHAQKIMIGKMELELSNKTLTVNYLTQELTKIMNGNSRTDLVPTANDMLMF